jgi:antitoxin MazE
VEQLACSEWIMDTHIARWGNSLALRIPRPVADTLHLVEGRRVELSVEEDRLVIRPRGRYRLDDLLAGITAENLPETSFDDRPVGEEAL